MIHTNSQMKRLDEDGFIPLLLTIITVVVVVIYLVFTRVMHAKQ